MNTSKKIFLLSILLFLGGRFLCQEYLFDFKSIDTEDGLASFLTTAVAKDQKGFLWIATSYGLNRYDGYSFKLFTKEKNGLFSNVNIQKIECDDQGMLWLYYKNLSVKVRGYVPDSTSIDHIDIFNPTTGKAIPFNQYFKSKSPFNIQQVYLPNITDAKNRLWIATKTGKIYLYQKKSFKKVFELKNTVFQFITIDQGDQISLGWKQQLIRLDQHQNIIEKLRLPNQIIGLWAGDDDQIWLGTIAMHRAGITIWSLDKKKQLTPIQFIKNNLPLKLIDGNIIFIHKINDLWFIDLNGVLNIFDSKGAWLDEMLPYGDEHLQLEFLNYYKESNNLWLNSHAGLHKISFKKNNFQLVFSHPSLSDSRGICEDEHGNIYFTNNIPYKFTPQTGTLQKLSEERSTYAMMVRDSILWTSDYDVFRLGYEINLNTLDTTRYRTKLGNSAYTILPSLKEDLYLVGHNKGLSYLNIKEKQVIPLENKDQFSQIDNSYVHHLHRNEKGIWAATNNGLFLLTEEEGVLFHFNKANNSLPFNFLQHLMEDSEGYFWIATKGGGIIKWKIPEDLNQGSNYTQFTISDGLSDNHTYAVYEDDYQNLWIPSDKGLMCMEKSTGQIRTYLTDHGLPHNEFNFSSHYKAKNGQLYFGGLGGIICLNPKNFQKTQADQTPLEFTGYYLLEEDEDNMTDKTDELLKSKEIIIKPTDKVFELWFSFLDFENPQYHKYAYQIEGYSNNWNYIDENYIRITHLPYGHYNLLIKGKSSDEKWSTHQLKLHINVIKPFYLHTYFFLSTFLILALGIFFFLRWRTQNLIKKQIILERTVKERTLTIAQQKEELEKLNKAKDQLFGIIAHDLRRPALAFRGIGKKVQYLLKKEQFDLLETLGNSIEKESKSLNNLLNNLLNWALIQKGGIPYNPELFNSSELIEEIVEEYKNYANEKNIIVETTLCPKGSIWADLNGFSTITRNLLSNAIKFTKEGGTVRISSQSNGNFLLFKIIDSGIGIPAEKIESLFSLNKSKSTKGTKGEKGTGLGLILVKEMIELNKGSISVESTADMGTTFCFQLPKHV